MAASPGVPVEGEDVSEATVLLDGGHCLADGELGGLGFEVFALGFELFGEGLGFFLELFYLGFLFVEFFD